MEMHWDVVTHLKVQLSPLSITVSCFMHQINDHKRSNTIIGLCRDSSICLRIAIPLRALTSNYMPPKIWMFYLYLLQHNLISWWRHQMETFSALLALCAGNSPVPVNSPYKGQWRGALMFSLMYAWIHDWVNNREAGDLRRHRGHFDVNVMFHRKRASYNRL